MNNFFTMKKIFAMFAAILFCGSMMVSCSKDDDKNDDSTQYPTKADMVGTWTGTYTGTAMVEGNNENYTLNWTLTLNPENANTVGVLRYTATFTTLQDLSFDVVVNDYYVRENTNTGRIKLTGNQMAGIVEDMIDFDIDLSAKTLKGTLEVHTAGEDMVTLGGETTLTKQ
jgi:hypothetical protein